MLDGYVTYKELKLITGLPENILNALIVQGVNQRQLEVDNSDGVELKHMLYNLAQFEKWMRVHIY